MVCAALPPSPPPSGFTKGLSTSVHPPTKWLDIYQEMRCQVRFPLLKNCPRLYFGGESGLGQGLLVRLPSEVPPKVLGGQKEGPLSCAHDTEFLRDSVGSIMTGGKEQ